MAAPDQFRQYLADGDVDGLVGLWAQANPGLPRPETREQAEIWMHYARTRAETIPLRPRAYSHAWLLERSLPSGLPDALKPSAQKLYPVIVEAVGVSVNFGSSLLKPAAAIVQRAMCDAVEEAYADGRREPAFVKRRMAIAKRRAFKQLGL